METSERTCCSDVRDSRLGRKRGTKGAQRHTLIFERQVREDRRYVRPTDVKKMLLKQARSTYRKKWASKHEHEELKEGIWLEPALALLRRRTKEEWTDKHSNVATKLVCAECWNKKRGLQRRKWQRHCDTSSK